MNRTEVMEALTSGKKVRHEYYSDNEFVFINKQAELETEDGHTHGTFNDEFWKVYQKWDEGWSIVEDVKNESKVILQINE